MLQSALVGRYLAYDPASREHVNDTFLVTTATQNVKDLVGNGFMHTFKILSNIELLIMVSILQSSFGPIGLLPMGIFPVCIIAFLVHRTARTTEYMEVNELADKAVTDHLSRTAYNFDLIRDFKKRGEQVGRFQKTLKEFNRTVKRSGAVATNNKYFSLWLADILIGLWIVFGGYALIHPEDKNLAWMNLTLGEFLTTMAVFKRLGSSFTSIYSSVLSISSTFPCLKNIVALMNLPVEDTRLLQISRMQLESAEKVMEQLKGNEHSDQSISHFAKMNIMHTLDRLPAFQTKRLVLFRGDQAPAEGQHGLEMTVLQGQLAVIMGGSRTGKHTLLKALAGVEPPVMGEIFMAPHLCVLHVPAQPLFFKNRSLYMNLCLGAQRTSDKNPERVGTILRRLRLAEEFVERAKCGKDDDGGSFWSRRGLTVRQKALLNLARAFVANPEVLILHTPLEHYGELDRKNVMLILQEFVQQRGLEQDPAGFQRRHPRTCIMTTRSGNSKAMLDSGIRRMILLDPRTAGPNDELISDVAFDELVPGDRVE
jgi:ABC-type multidrug transport system fused ATPase/permease subunit